MSQSHVYGSDYRHIPCAPLGIIATPGGRDLARLIDAELVKEREK